MVFMNKNILHVVNISFVIPYFLGEQLNWFVNKGYNEYIVCSGSDELIKFSKRYHYRYKAVDILRKISILKDVKAVLATAWYIKVIKADVVTGHTPKGGLIAMMAAYFTRVPVRIYFRHGLVYETSYGIKRSLLINIDRLASKFATKVICVSPSVAKRSLEDKLNSVSKQMVLLNGTCNGIDVERFNRDNINDEEINKLRSEYGICDGDFIIGFTGRLVRDKGIIELVRAYQKLHENYDNVRLLLVGMFETRDALPEDVVKIIKDDNSIIKAGYIDYSEIEKYYALMNVYVLASYREGFPTSVLEASSMKIPVITTRATGCVDSILNEETGLFIGHDENELYSALLRLYHDENERKRLGDNGRDFVETNFNQSIIWNEIEKLYI